MMVAATEIAKENKIDPVFATRVGRKRRADGEVVAPRDIFKSDFFDYLFDVATSSTIERFECLKQHYEYFSFLYNINDLEDINNSGELLKHCEKLENVLTKGGHADIDAKELCNELAFVATIIKNYDVRKPLDVLNTISKLEMTNLLPNTVVAYRILLTLPIGVATGERSFSKLKLIKNHLRSTMEQDRLNGLSLISIEYEIADSLSYDEIINDFASKKARKGNF